MTSTGRVTTLEEEVLLLRDRIDNLKAENARLRQTVEDQAQALRQEKEEVDRMRPLW